MELWKSALMGVVEGLTEFLPISSTGHLILTAQLTNFLTGPSRAFFEIFIQLGAICAIVWLYRVKLWTNFAGCYKKKDSRLFYGGLFVAFCPAAIVGLLFHEIIKAWLFSPLVVASAFIIGGLLILWVEKRATKPIFHQTEQINLKTAFAIGLFQCLALIPGTSRSGATIVGGLLLGFSRKLATEFSFFLAIPTLTAAAFYDLWKNWELLDQTLLSLLLVGFLCAFFSALIAAKTLLKFIANHDFRYFAWYRVAFGLLILFTHYAGLIDWLL